MTEPTLVISASADELVIEARTTKELTVSVSAIGGHSSTLTATVSDKASGVASVTPMKRPNVVVDTTVIFTVEGLDAGDTTITLTASSHPDYQLMSTEVTVSVYLPGVGLSVPTSLVIVRETSEILTIEVSESTQATITIGSGNDNIATVSSQAFTLMGGGDSRAEVRVNGVGTGMTTLTITAMADGYANEKATVIVEVLDPLRIDVDTNSLSLVEGGDSTQISVRLNRIDAARDTVTVTINLQEGSELTVVPSSLEFTDTETRTVMVRAKDDVNDEYRGIRDETLRLTADDYAMAMVTVEITDNDPQPIRLEVGSTELSLVRFASTEITVSVDIAADLTVRAEGAVRLAGDNVLVRTNLGEMGSTQIEISGVSEGKGTVSFTVSGARKATDTVVVSVDVTRPTLVISEVSPSNINLLTRETTVVTVSVSAVGNHRSTLTAMVTGIGNSVTPTEIIGVRAGTPATFTVTVGLAARDETLTLTASHPLYKSARTKVDVSVSLRPLELSVEPSPLVIVTGMSGQLTVGVSATEGVTLTVTVRDANIIEELADEYLLMSGETSTKITVRGDNIGDTTLTMTAEAEGYTSPTRTVSIEVLDLLRIEADTDRLSLVEGGDSTELRVSLNRIDADSGTVTVTINLQLGSELTVVPSSLEFTGTETRTVMVRAKNDIDDEYIGIRDETLTLTADDYAMATVTVEITDNDPQTDRIKREVINRAESGEIREYGDNSEC